MKRRTLVVFLILILLFIWGNSCIPKDASADESGFITGIIEKVFSVLLGRDITVNPVIIRKLAHVTEHFLLTLDLFAIAKYDMKRKDAPKFKKTSTLGSLRALALSRKNIKTTRLLVCLQAFLVAFTDETIQILSGRGPQIQDVWIDSIGIAVGVILSLFL